MGMELMRDDHDDGENEAGSEAWLEEGIGLSGIGMEGNVNGIKIEVR